MDRVGKNSKNDFKNSIFLQFILGSVMINCHKFYENLMVICLDIKEIRIKRFPKIFTLSLSPSSVQGKKEILRYGTTGEGESMGNKRKTYNSCFHFRFHYYK
jgi:hypothetical protein